MAVTGRARPPAGLVLAGSPAWPAVHEALSDAAVSVEALPVQPAAGEAALRHVGATADGWLGAVALHSGGILVDHGWLRVYGAGCPARRLPGLADVNPDPCSAAYLLVAADVLGGRYVIRGRDGLRPALPGKPGEICYLGADSLHAEPLEWSYRDWLTFMLGGAIGDFYHDLRWPGWESDASAVPLDRLLSLHPPVYTREGRAQLPTAEREHVDPAELYDLLDELTGLSTDPPAGS